jgi:hypothetical protein
VITELHRSPAGQILAIGEGQAVDHRIERLAQPRECCGKLGQVVVLGDIARQDAIDRQPFRQRFDRFLLMLPQVGQRQLRAFPRESLRNGIGQAPLIGDS